MGRSTGTGRFDAVAVAVVAVAVCAPGMTRPSLWTDEAATISGAHRSLAQLWRMLHSVDAVHGVYYAVMHFWIAAFGISALSLRFPSLLAVAAAAAGVVVLGRMVASRRTALVAGLVFVLLPRVTWMAIEARSSALATAAAAWATVALVTAMRRGRGWWALYAASVAVVTLVFLDAVLVLAAHAVSVAWCYRRRPRSAVPWVAAAAAVVVVTTPFVLIATAQSKQVRATAPSLVKTSVNVLVGQWFLGALPTASQQVHLRPLPPPAWTTAALVLAAVVELAMVLAVVLALRSARLRPADRRAEPTLVALAVPWVVVPVVLLVAYAALVEPVYSPRYLSFTTPAVALLAGEGIARVRHRWLVPAAVLGVALLSLPVYLSQRGPYAKKQTDWAAAAEVVATHAAPGDAVVHTVLQGHQEVTTRKMTVAYPGPFARLRDLTLHRTPLQTHGLWGSTYPLAQVADRLDGVRTVWVLTDASRPLDSRDSPEAPVLTAHGFAVVWSWRGPSTDVYELRRS